jgi:hypothetical protein
VDEPSAAQVVWDGEAAEHGRFSPATTTARSALVDDSSSNAHREREVSGVGGLERRPLMAVEPSCDRVRDALADCGGGGPEVDVPRVEVAARHLPGQPC